MLELISILLFVVLIAVIAVHFTVRTIPRLDVVLGKERKLKMLDGLRLLIFVVLAFLPEQKMSPIQKLRKLVCIVTAFSFVVLAITGFVPRLVFGVAIHGVWLMVHATFAPVLAICLALLALLWADHAKLDKNYIPWLSGLLQQDTHQKTKPAPFELSEKMLFWVMLFLSLPMMVSIVASMFPIAGTHWQHILFEIHRYVAIAFSVVVLGYAYIVLCQKLEAIE